MLFTDGTKSDNVKYELELLEKADYLLLRSYTKLREKEEKEIAALFSVITLKLFDMFQLNCANVIVSALTLF